MRIVLRSLRNPQSIQRQRRIPEKTSRKLSLPTRKSEMRRMHGSNTRMLGKRLQNRPMPKRQRLRVLLSMRQLRERLLRNLRKAGTALRKGWSERESKPRKNQERRDREMAERKREEVHMPILRKTVASVWNRRKVLPLRKRNSGTAHLRT